MNRTRDAELMSVAGTFATALDAELARLVLGEQDITSRLEGEVLSGAPFQGTSGVRLLVADEHAEQAAQLLQEHERKLAAERRPTETADERAARAYRLALVGCMIFPVVTQAISLGRVLCVPWSALSKRGRRHYLVALLLDSLVLGAFTYWLVDELYLDATPTESVELPVPALPE